MMFIFAHLSQLLPCGAFVIMFAILAGSGCAFHQPWRLVNGDAGLVLVPPDVKAPTLVRRTLKADVAPGDTICPAGAGAIDLKVNGKHARVTVAARSLNEQPTGGLLEWTSELEATHCLAPGEGVKLAGRIAESVPLDPAAALRLLNTDDRQTGEVELGPQARLRVVSPYWRKEGAGMIDGPVAVAADRGNDRHLIATANYTENLLGTETSLYAVRPKVARAGYTITPLYADVHIQAETGPTTERRPRPAIDYLKFPEAAAFYRLFYKSGQTYYTGLVVAGRTPAELDQLTKVLEASGDSASCEKIAAEMCIAIPKDVAVNPMISVTVNGAEVLVTRGASVAGAIQAAGERQPRNLLRSLIVSKPSNGRMMPVTFDPEDTAILNMPLRGGEVVSWH
jgi:hypothetical protein